ncbi:MAG: electron transfer flavoprotein, partial [Deltaproteobacteria bacterium]|nr:electron transfer flavoprotein [Deltaproteobacteria bacterium]
MKTVLISPASANVFGVPTLYLSIAIPLIATIIFAFMMLKRLAPALKAMPDPRLDRLPDRVYNMMKYALFHFRHPRYPLAGLLHILIFSGFVILSLHSISLPVAGILEGWTFPGLSGQAGRIYGAIKTVGATLVLLAAVIAMVRRGVFKPERYNVPEKYGKNHTAEAVLILAMI